MRGKRTSYLSIFPSRRLMSFRKSYKNTEIFRKIYWYWYVGNKLVVYKRSKKRVEVFKMFVSKVYIFPSRRLMSFRKSYKNSICNPFPFQKIYFRYWYVGKIKHVAYLRSKKRLEVFKKGIEGINHMKIWTLYWNSTEWKTWKEFLRTSNYL